MLINASFIRSIAIAIAICPFASNAQVQAPKAIPVTFQGNRFECTPARVDTMAIEDPITGEQIYKYVTVDPVPLTVNGRKIYNAKETAPMTALDNSGTVAEKYLLQKLTPDFDKLPNGIYAMDIYNLVIDETSTVVYYQYNFRNCRQGGIVPSGIQTSVADKITAILATAPKFNPFTVNGKPVAFLSEPATYTIDVQEHKSTIKQLKY